MQVQKRKFHYKNVQIKYMEASWPANPVIHRIEPLHGTMHGHTKKRHREDEKRDEQIKQAQSYKNMLGDLMVEIKNYLFLIDSMTDDDGARNSLQLVNGTAQTREDNRICIWLKDIQDTD